MLKKQKRWRLTDEQRKRIMEEPGVVVHRREGPPNDSLPEPRLRVLVPITASELIDDDEDESIAQ